MERDRLNRRLRVGMAVDALMRAMERLGDRGEIGAGALNALESNCVLYETAMGYPRRLVIWKYVLRNALIGTVTQIGLIFGILLAGAVVVEAVFDWPGLGLFAVNSILNSDYNAVMGFTLIAGTMFIVVNLVVDILQGMIDPRETR